MSAFNVLNLGILLRNYDESIISQKMLEFDCPNNSEINDFFHNKAIGSVQRHQTATFLVVDNQNQINGFYSLTHKSLNGVISIFHGRSFSQSDSVSAYGACSKRQRR